MELTRAFPLNQDGRIYIEELNGPFLFKDKGTPAVHSAGSKTCSGPGMAGTTRKRDVLPIWARGQRAVCVTSSVAKALLGTGVFPSEASAKL
jgi:hypothetical protein